jgi:hypothetical protein
MRTLLRPETWSTNAEEELSRTEEEEEKKEEEKEKGRCMLQLQ